MGQAGEPLPVQQTSLADQEFNFPHKESVWDATNMFKFEVRSEAAIVYLRLQNGRDVLGEAQLTIRDFIHGFEAKDPIELLLGVPTYKGTNSFQQRPRTGSLIAAVPFGSRMPTSDEARFL